VAHQGEKRSYKIQARSDRYLVCTKPFNLRKTVIYTIVDLDQYIRGTTLKDRPAFNSRWGRNGADDGLNPQRDLKQGRVATRTRIDLHADRQIIRG
jgi:hypothetical protein